MCAHRQGEHVLSSDVMAFVYSYLYHEFSCLYESGVNLELAATFAARASEWAPDKTSKRLQALRMASWAHLKLNQPAQALAFARKAVTEDPASPKNNFLFVHAAASIGADGSEANVDEALRALDALLETTNYDASCLEVLSSSALEEGHTELAAAMLSRWLHRGPMAAADGKLLPCLQQLYRVQLGGRDIAALELDEVQSMAAHVRIADERLGTFGAEAAHGAEEDVWWAAALAWNLALRARALGAHQLSVECLQVALHLADRLQSGARARQLSLDCHELMACAMCTYLDAALQQPQQPLTDPEQIARGALQTRAHAQGALRLLDALDAEEAHVAAGTSHEEAHAATERARLRKGIRQRMQLIAIEMEVFTHAFPSHCASSAAPTTAQLSARIEEAVAGSLLLPEQLEHISQRALSLEARAHGIHTVAALGYRRACEAYARALELGEPAVAPAAGGGPQPFSDRFVRLCVCVQRLSERLSEADACLDADLRAKYCTMLALAEKRPASRPSSWPELLEWLVDRAERWATRAMRSDRLQSAEAWMSCAINMQTALLACAPAARRSAHDQLLREVLQPKYDKLLARRAAGSADQVGFASPLKPGSAQLMDVMAI
jgi:tetratricopeptide (TPR) repeat protein